MIGKFDSRNKVYENMCEKKKRDIIQKQWGTLPEVVQYDHFDKYNYKIKKKKICLRKHFQKDPRTLCKHK